MTTTRWIKVEEKVIVVVVLADHENDRVHLCTPSTPRHNVV